MNSSLITYHLSLITYHLSLITYHLSLITYHLLLITYYLSYHLQPLLQPCVALLSFTRVHRDANYLLCPDHNR